MTRKFEKHTNRGLSNAALKSTLTQHLLQMRVCISLVLSLSIHRSARRTLIECFFKLTRGWTDAGKLQTSRWFAGEIFSFGASTPPLVSTVSRYFPRMTCLSFGRHVIFRHRMRSYRKRQKFPLSLRNAWIRSDSKHFPSSQDHLVSRGRGKERNSIPGSLRF